MLAMRKKRYDDKLHLDMGFSEAMERFAGVKPSEMHANIRKAKKKKPPGGKKHAPSGDTVSGQNVVRLRDRRKSHHG
jgi:hypothetical protein